MGNKELSFHISTQRTKGAEIISITRNEGTTQNPPDIDLSDCVLFERIEAYNEPIREIYLRHPYKPETISMEYGAGRFLEQAQQVAEQDSLDPGHPNATVLVKNDGVVGHGANGSTYHDEHGCKRKELDIPTGQGYELCEGCHPKNHSEPTAIRATKTAGNKNQLRGATAYLYGHWWCCQPCCTEMEKVGIEKVVFSKTWTANFLGINR